MLNNVKDGFVRDVLLSPTIDKINLSIALDKVSDWLDEDIDNYGLSDEVVDKRVEFFGEAMDAYYLNGNYGSCRDHLINYFSV